jgi:hypothetical protein
VGTQAELKVVKEPGPNNIDSQSVKCFKVLQEKKNHESLHVYGVGVGGTPCNREEKQKGGREPKGREDPGIGGQQRK